MKIEKIITSLWYAAALGLVILLLTACASREPKLSSEKKLVVGTSADFAPFAFIKNGIIQGFEIDIAKEICKRLEYELEIKDLPFDALIPAVHTNSVHFVAAGMSATEERKKVVNFTFPYLEGEPLIIVYKDNGQKIESTADLKQMTVAVNNGYTAEYYATEVLGITPLRLGNPVEAMMALTSDRADAFITARNTIAPLIAANKQTSFALFEIEGTSENCAIILPKESDQLLQKINQTLIEMKEDGTLLEIKKKWSLT